MKKEEEDTLYIPVYLKKLDWKVKQKIKQKEEEQKKILYKLKRFLKL